MIPDRFVPPSQTSLGLQYSRLNLQTPKPVCGSKYHASLYQRAVAAALFGRDTSVDTRVLSFQRRGRKVTPQSVFDSETRPDWRVQEARTVKSMSGIIDDVYNHSFALSEGNIALCGRRHSFSIINLTSNKDYEYYVNEQNSDEVSATHLIGSNLALIGTTRSTLDTMDVNAERFTHGIQFQHSTIRIIDHVNDNEIYTGFRSGAVIRIDPRDPQQDEIVQLGNQTITSLAIKRLVAIGNNQNQLFLFDPRKFKDPVAELTGHRAGVTSLEWLDDNHLVSGSGTDDRCLRLWCTKAPETPTMIADTKSQVTGVHKLDQQTFVSTHGYLATMANKVRLWSIRDRKFICLRPYKSPHEGRVVSSAMSNSTLITGSGDNPDFGHESKMCVWNFTKRPSHFRDGPKK